MIGCLLYIFGLIVTCLFLMFASRMALILAVPIGLILAGFWIIIKILSE